MWVQECAARSPHVRKKVNGHGVSDSAAPLKHTVNGMAAHCGFEMMSTVQICSQLRIDGGARRFNVQHSPVTGHGLAADVWRLA